MNWKIKWLGICLMCILSACGSVDYMEIQTYNPAEVTFPKTVRKVLVVNNSVPQPPDDGYKYKGYGKKQQSATVQKDSAMVEAVNALGYNIADASFFEDVLLYNGCTKSTLGQYAVREEYTPSEVKELCESTGADAIISWDRLRFNTERKVEFFVEGYLEEVIQISIDGMLRVYLPERTTPLASIPVRDTIEFSDIAYDIDQLEQLMPSTEEALFAAAEYIAGQQTGNFVPHWSDETRWMYNHGTSRWREASAYAYEGKWDDAAKRWKSLYSNSSNWNKKAKAASNLALYYEMKTDLKTAFEWVEKSCQQLETHKDDELHSYDLQQLYKKVLHQRLELDKKLNMQIGAE